MIFLNITPSQDFYYDNAELEFIFYIDDLQNNIFYNGQYINISVQKNGTTNPEILYPLRYIKQPLKWTYIPDETGTFVIHAIIQGEPKYIITTNSFIVKAQTCIAGVNTNNNICNFMPKHNIIKAPVRQSEDAQMIMYNKSKIDPNIFNRY